MRPKPKERLRPSPSTSEVDAYMAALKRLEENAEAISKMKKGPRGPISFPKGRHTTTRSPRKGQNDMARKGPGGVRNSLGGDDRALGA